jgi:2-succinyl-5-enolpyruvyl-6-hydroxy-3-cyclohexene-1-carboxylate synthase
MKEYAMKNFSFDELAGMYAISNEHNAKKDKLIKDLKDAIKRAIYCIEVIQDEYDDTCEETLELIKELRVL